MEKEKACSGSWLMVPVQQKGPRAEPFSRECALCTWAHQELVLIKKSAASLEHLFPKEELGNVGALITVVSVACDAALMDAEELQELLKCREQGAFSGCLMSLSTGDLLGTSVAVL